VCVLLIIIEEWSLVVVLTPTLKSLIRVLHGSGSSGGLGVSEGAASSHVDRFGLLALSSLSLYLYYGKVGNVGRNTE